MQGQHGIRYYSNEMKLMRFFDVMLLQFASYLGEKGALGKSVVLYQ